MTLFYWLLNFALVGGFQVYLESTHTRMFQVSVEKSAKPLTEVRAYKTKYCSACIRAERELSSAELPFKVRWVDVSDGSQPTYIQTVPAFEWEVGGKVRYLTYWPGTNGLISSWQQTQKASP